MSSDKHPLMPHATATWLVDNTALGFEQIAEFCGLHILEVQAMADDLASTKYTGRDPVRAGEVTQEEIEKGQDDPSYRLKMEKGPKQVLRTKGSRYTPVSKRKDKPDGIAWILRNHPEISDAQIGKLIGTTRNTINAIRDRSHWNIAEIQPKDPVTLGLCSQRELDAIVAKAAKKAGIIDEEKSDPRLGGDKAALIEELQAERRAEKLAAEKAMMVAEAEARAAERKAEEEAMIAALGGQGEAEVQETIVDAEILFSSSEDEADDEAEEPAEIAESMEEDESAEGDASESDDAADDASDDGQLA